MTKEEDSGEIQSSVQYKRFDNSDAEDDAKPGGDTTSTSTADASPSPPSVSDSDDAKDGRSTARNGVGERRGRSGEKRSTEEETIASAAEAASEGKDKTGGRRGGEIVLQVDGGLSAAAGQTAHEPAWNWLNLVVSIASIFCCSVCGVLATVTSVLAYVDHRVGDAAGANRKRVASYGLALAALVVGVICMVVVILVAIHLDNKND